MTISCGFPLPAYALSQALEPEAFSAAIAPLHQHFNEVDCRLSSLPCLPAGNWHDLATRRQEFNAMTKASDLIWPLRGGHGCLDLIPDALALDISQPPLLLGFSDISALHACWWQRAWPQIHCYMPAVPHGPRAQQSLLERLSGEAFHWNSMGGGLIQGKAQGPAYISCLRLLAALAGTPAQPNLHGCLLFIEDIDERPYMLDRCLQQCALAGILDGIVGLVGGCFPISDARASDPSVAMILQHWGQRLAVPTAWGLPFGHHPDPLSLSFGWQSELTVSRQGWELIHQQA